MNTINVLFMDRFYVTETLRLLPSISYQLNKTIFVGKQNVF